MHDDGNIIATAWDGNKLVGSARLMLLLCSFLLSAEQSAAITVSPKAGIAMDSITLMQLPKIVYMEHSMSNTFLNFEVSIKNHHKYPVYLREIEGLIFSKDQKLIRKVFYNPNQRPSLEFVNRRKISPGDSALLFNPFHTLENDEHFDHLIINLAFTDSLYQHYQKLSINIKPLRYESETVFDLPIKGNLLVWEGHDYYSNHRRMDYFRPYFAQQGIKGNFQRFAYDFVNVDSTGLMYGGGQKN